MYHTIVESITQHLVNLTLGKRYWKQTNPVFVSRRLSHFLIMIMNGGKVSSVFRMGLLPAAAGLGDQRGYHGQVGAANASSLGIG